TTVTSCRGIQPTRGWQRECPRAGPLPEGADESVQAHSIGRSVQVALVIAFDQIRLVFGTGEDRCGQLSAAGALRQGVLEGRLAGRIRRSQECVLVQRGKKTGDRVAAADYSTPGRRQRRPPLNGGALAQVLHEALQPGSVGRAVQVLLVDTMHLVRVVLRAVADDPHDVGLAGPARLTRRVAAATNWLKHSFARPFSIGRAVPDVPRLLWQCK